MLTARGVESGKVQTALVDWLKQQPGVLSAFSRVDLTRESRSDPLAKLVRASFHEERCGDVVFVLKPYYLLTSGLRGTLHGSPHEYDRHVPLLVYGTEVITGRRAEPVSPLAVAAVLCQA